MSSGNVLGIVGGLAAAVTAMHGPATTARAQWMVTRLNPTPATWCFAQAVSSGQQAGTVSGQAALWRGTAASWLNLNPPGRRESGLSAVSGSQQAGYLTVGEATSHASLWSGTADSWVDLNPVGSRDSYVAAISGGQQAGWASVRGMDHASIWSGTAVSWVDLHPPAAGGWESRANAASGGQQAGSAQVDGVPHASLWSGTAASWVDLHPPGKRNSVVYAISGSHQAGYVTVGEATSRASLWSGTADSWVDLHPTGSTESGILAASEGHQVGYADVDGVLHASLWSGTAATWVDLHVLLPAGFTNSVARGISIDGVNLEVVGSGVNSQTGYMEALLWTLPVCSAPAILSQPQPATSCWKLGAGFSVAASGATQLSYRWRKDGIPIDTNVNPSAASATLQIVRAIASDAGSYDCIVTNTCATSTISNPATLTTFFCICMLADIAGGGPDGLEGDSIIDGSDFIAFINAFAAGDMNTDPRADIAGGGLVGLDPDGIIDGTDFIIFINVFAAGC